MANVTLALALDEACNGMRVNAVNPLLTYKRPAAGMQHQPDLIAEFEARAS